MKVFYPFMLLVLMGCCIGLMITGCTDKAPEQEEMGYRDAISDSVYLHKHDIEVITQNLKDQSRNMEMVFGFVGGVITILLGVQISINRSNSKSFSDIGAILAEVRQEQKDKNKQCDIMHENIVDFKKDHETRIRTIESLKHKS